MCVCVFVCECVCECLCVSVSVCVCVCVSTKTEFYDRQTVAANVLLLVAAKSSRNILGSAKKLADPG